jgi:hypothetical protein
MPGLRRILRKNGRCETAEFDLQDFQKDKGGD